MPIRQLCLLDSSETLKKARIIRPHDQNQPKTSKIAIRNARKDANNEIKKTDSSEDLQKNAEIDIQELTDQYIVKVDGIIKVKEKEILTV